MKRTKARGPVQRDAKEVLAEVLGKLTGKLDAPAVWTSVKASRRGNTVGPNRDRLTVGVDLGDRWSQYCILALEGETLAEGQLRTTQEDVGFFTALKDGKNWGAGASGAPVVSGPYWFLSSKNRPRRKGCRRFLCSQSKLQSGPTERPHPRIQSRLTTTQSRHLTRAPAWQPDSEPQRRECTPMTTRSFALARLRRHREAFLNPRLPERCLAGDGSGRLIAVEVEAERRP